MIIGSAQIGRGKRIMMRKRNKMSMHDRLLWFSFYAAAAVAFLGIMAVDSASLFPAFAALVALIYLALVVVANADEFGRPKK